VVQASRLLEAFPTFQQAGRLHHKRSKALRVPSASDLRSVASENNTSPTRQRGKAPGDVATMFPSLARWRVGLVEKVGEPLPFSGLRFLIGNKKPSQERDKSRDRQPPEEA